MARSGPRSPGRATGAHLGHEAIRWHEAWPIFLIPKAKISGKVFDTGHWIGKPSASLLEPCEGASGPDGHSGVGFWANKKRQEPLRSCHRFLIPPFCHSLPIY
jgi:hypothetical protein